MIYTDGASRGNPGMAGAGIYIEGLSQIYNLSLFLGTKTNNEAEYLGLLAALRLLINLKSGELEKQSLANSQLLFLSDSKLLVEQMSGRWKIKNERMAKLIAEGRQLIDELAVEINFVHVGREINQQADWLANQAIDLGVSSQP
jgi:probable phosphoglycerate mutase